MTSLAKGLILPFKQITVRHSCVTNSNSGLGRLLFTVSCFGSRARRRREKERHKEAKRRRKKDSGRESRQSRKGGGGYYQDYHCELEKGLMIRIEKRKSIQ